MEIVITENRKGEIEAVMRRFKNQLSEERIKKLTATAINSTLSRSLPKIRKGIKQEYNMNQKYLQRIANVFPKAKSTQLFGGIQLKTMPIPMIAYKPKQTKAGVTLAIKKGKPTIVRRAFIITTKSGHQGVFARGEYESKNKKFRFYTKDDYRAGGGKSKTGKRRITQLLSVSPFAAGTKKSVAEEVQKFMGSGVVKRVDGILRGAVDRIARSIK